VELRVATEQAAAAIGETIPGGFQGDAHAFLTWVYKDPAKDLSVRVDAAKAAAPYEKPRLSQVDANVSGQIDVRSWLQKLGEPD
jgi:hypothetical protein